MGVGLAVVLLWSYLDITVIDNIVPAMAANWLEKNRYSHTGIW